MVNDFVQKMHDGAAQLCIRMEIRRAPALSESIAGQRWIASNDLCEHAFGSTPAEAAANLAQYVWERNAAKSVNPKDKG